MGRACPLVLIGAKLLPGGMRPVRPSSTNELLCGESLSNSHAPARLPSAPMPPLTTMLPVWGCQRGKPQTDVAGG